MSSERGSSAPMDTAGNPGQGCGTQATLWTLTLQPSALCSAASPQQCSSPRQGFLQSEGICGALGTVWVGAAPFSGVQACFLHSDMGAPWSVAPILKFTNLGVGQAGTSAESADGPPAGQESPAPAGFPWSASASPPPGPWLRTVARPRPGDLPRCAHGV